MFEPAARPVFPSAHRTAVPLLAGLLLAVLVPFLTAVGAPASTAARAPEAVSTLAAPALAAPALAVPGVPADPVQIYFEDFENWDPASPIVRLPAYVGSAATGNATYSAAAPWLANCNGWIVEWNQSINPAAQVADCGSQGIWNRTMQLAQALGVSAGQTLVDARANTAVSAFTQGANPGVGKIEFQTTKDLVLPTATGRFLTTSIDVAAFSCPPVANAPLLQFQIVGGAVVKDLGAQINTCATGQNVQTEARGAAGAAMARAGRYTTDGSVLWQSSAAGLRLINNEGSGVGNDHAFDKIRILDATPRLDKSFTPRVFAAGVPNRLDFTMTNTSELASKNGWSFTDNLSAGLKVADDPRIASTCPSSVVNAAPGATTVSVTGNLSKGMASCTVSVDVVAAAPGAYSNGAANLAPSVGADLPPVPVTATVVDTDYGDAPTSYGTDGASHTATAGLGLGAVRDNEVSASPSAAADGDDGAPLDDEDALSGTITLRADQPMSRAVTVRNTTGATATLVGWIDLNADGDFDDAGERSTPVPVPAGAASATLSWPAGAGAVSGASFVRLRLYPAGAGVFAPTGAVTGGEIEDHPVLLQVPKLSLTKTASAVDDRDGNGVDAGDVISYTIRVANDGNTVLDPVTVSDPLLGGAVPCGATPLASGTSRTCPVLDYTLTQADLDAGERTNTATALGTPPSGPAVSADGSTRTDLPASSSLTMVKSHDAISDPDANGPDAGDTVIYSFRVLNTGNRTLTGLVVDDPLAGPVACPATTLAPGAAATCTATYRLTGADVDNGRVLNTATARMAGPGGQLSAESSDTLVVPPRSALVLDKSVAGIVDTNHSGRQDAGDRIDYRFAVTNTGNVTLDGIAVTDPLVGAVDCPVRKVASDATALCQGSYTITQADADAGSVRNTATARGTDPHGDAVLAAEDVATAPITPVTRLVLTKRAAAPADVNGNGLVDTGDTIEYSFEVTNAGSVTMRGLRIDDPKVQTGVDCPVGPLAPGAATTCTGSYAITQAEVDAGVVRNAAVASADTPGGAKESSNTGVTSTPTSTAQSLALDKTIGSTVDVNQNDRLDAGDTIRYRFLITNTGPTTIEALAVQDPKTSGADCPVTRLAPTESTTCAQTYAVTQADVDRGRVSNTATAAGTGTGPAKPPVTSPEDSVSVDTDSAAGLVLDKQVSAVSDPDHSGKVDAGDDIDYAFVVTNTGAVTMTEIAVDDPLLAEVVCPATRLAPGDHLTCHGLHRISQADVNAGSVHNTATASGFTPSGGNVTSAPDSTVTPTASDAALDLDKKAGVPTDVDGSGGVNAGDRIEYTFEVSNTGSVTISDILVTDPRFARADIACPAGNGSVGLDPGSSATCRADYVITQADVDHGSVDNTASAAGTAGGRPVESPTDSTSTPTDHSGALTLHKTIAGTHDVNGNGLLDAGDSVDYEFLVTNSGAVTAEFVSVQDPNAGAVDCRVTTLAPGAEVTCTKTYSLTQADVDAGAAHNTASAAAKTPDGDPISSPEDSATIQTDSVGALSLSKEVRSTTDVDQDQRLEEGDTVDYAFTVRNTGTVTIDEVTMADPLIADQGGEVSCPDGALAPGAVTTCTATYSLTQVDLDAGIVTNRARVRGEDPRHEPVESDQAAVDLGPDSISSLALDKEASALADSDGSGGATPGDEVGYRFTVTNTGTTTLGQVQAEDPLLVRAHVAVTCPEADLAPGAAVVCTATYPVTQADIDRGEVVNVAHATATDPADLPVESAADSARAPIEQHAMLDLKKTAGTPTDANHSGRLDAQDTLGFEFAVSNTGNVTVRDVKIRDPRISDVRCPVATLAPGEATVCTGDYVLTKKDVLARKVVNTATVAGNGPAGNEVESAPSTATAMLPSAPSLRIDKRAKLLDRDGDDRADRGETIRYLLTVSNTGNVGLKQVAVDDPMLVDAGIEVRCPRTELAVGAAMTCSADYQVHEDDLDVTIRNVAVASAEDVAGVASDDPVRSGHSAAEVPVDPEDRGLLPNTGGPQLATAVLGMLLMLGGWLLLRRRSRDSTPGGKHSARRAEIGSVEEQG